mmetsp:Transcript_61954/g.195818  ORF Transcript_61954/g.195818 Transcript_61954/m.195818 type:complete len:203 (+) Transcript_61954:1161-1769(+)
MPCTMQPWRHALVGGDVLDARRQQLALNRAALDVPDDGQPVVAPRGEQRGRVQRHGEDIVAVPLELPVGARGELVGVVLPEGDLGVPAHGYYELVVVPPVHVLDRRHLLLRGGRAPSRGPRAQVLEARPVGEVPHLEGAVVPPRDEAPLVLVKRHGGHLYVPVSLGEAEAHAAGLEVPHAHRAHLVPRHHLHKVALGFWELH